MLTLIAAVDQRWAIGKNGQIPWDVPEDLAEFKRETLGGALIMGRKTWESLPFRPFPKRLNLVLSSSLECSEHVFRTVHEAVGFAHMCGHHRVYGIGGHSVYEALMPLADRMMITRVKTTVAGADTFFPDVNFSEWSSVGKYKLKNAAPESELTEYLRISG